MLFQLFTKMYFTCLITLIRYLVFLISWKKKVCNTSFKFRQKSRKPVTATETYNLGSQRSGCRGQTGQFRETLSRKRRWAAKAFWGRGRCDSVVGGLVTQSTLLSFLQSPALLRNHKVDDSFGKQPALQLLKILRKSQCWLWNILLVTANRVWLCHMVPVREFSRLRQEGAKLTASLS